MPFTTSLVYAVKIALCCCLAAVNQAVDQPPTALLTAHNRERKLEKLAPLTLSPKLCESAGVHARDMAQHHTLDHTGSDHSTVSDRVKKVGYVYIHVGENIAKGQSTVEQVMDAWLHSPGHRANILGEFTEMGAARVEDDDGAAYWCVNFGAPMPRLQPDVAAAAVVKQINSTRVADGKVVLKADPALAKGAMAITAAMAAKGSLDLEGDPVKLISEKAILGKEIRLQLSAGVPTSEEAAKALLGDDRELLDPFREIGVGYAVAKNGTPYWCAIFAKPVGASRPARPR